MRKLKFLSISALLGTFVLSMTSCDQKDWAPEIGDLNDKLEKLATSVEDLKSQTASMTYIKSITMGEDGKLTITPSTGSAVIYDAKEYVKFDVKFENNTLFVKNPGETEYTAKGQVDPSKFTYGISADGFLTINGVKTAADLGTYIKNNTSATPIVPTVSADGYLVINGVKTTVKVNPTITAVNGELFVNGVATGVKVAAANAVVINKDAQGNVISVDLTDAKGNTANIKVSPSQEPLSSLVFIPQYLDYSKGGHYIPLKTIMSIDQLADQLSAFVGVQNVQYRINPTTANTVNTKWTFTTRQVQTRATGDKADMFLAPTSVAPYGTDALQFNLVASTGTLNQTWATLNPANKGIILSLQGDDKDVFSGKPTKVVSDYSLVLPVEYKAFVSNKVVGKGAVAPFYTDYKTSKSVVENFSTLPDFEIVYNNATKTNLNNLVLATAQEILKPADRKLFEEHGFSGYSFVFTENSYNGADGVTDQAAFINIETNGDITVLQGTAAIDRLPIVKVDIKNSANLVVATAYIKFLITPVATKPVEKVIEGGDILYKDLFTGVALSTTAGDEWSTNVTDVASMTWEMMNNIYTELGISHNDFNAIYAPVTPTISYNNTATSAKTSDFIRSTNGPNVDSYAMKVQANPYSKFGANSVVVTYAPTGRPALKITFNYNVVKPVLDKNILVGYQDNDPNSILVKGGLVAGSYQMQLALGEAFQYGNAIVADATSGQTAKPAYRAPFAAPAMTPAVAKIGGATHQFLFTGVYASPKQVAIDGVTYANNTAAAKGPASNMNIDLILGTAASNPKPSIISLVDKLTTADRVYAMDFKTTYVNLEVDSYNFTVRFVNPLSLTLITSPKWTFIDEIRGYNLNVLPNYVVKCEGKTMADAAAGATVLTYKTANTATTVDAADYLSIATAINPNDQTTGLFFTLTPPADYHNVTKVNASAKEGTLNWVNAGTTIITPVGGGSVKATFKTSFAEISRDENLTIAPR